MKTKSISKNYIYNLIYQLLILFLPLITVPYISRVLGAENIGIYSYTISITTYFITFASLGMALYGQREIAFNQNNKKQYSKIFYEIVTLRLIMLFISLIIFYFVFVLGNNDYSTYYKVLCLEIIANVFDISWFFQGLEEFKKTVFRNIIVKLVSLVAIFVFVKTKDDLIIYFIIYVLSTFLGNISLWFYLPRYLDKIKIKELKIFKHLKPTIALFIPQIAIQVYTLLDKTMIGAIISDKTEVGYYDQAQKIIKMLLTIITSLGTVMMPRIASTYAEGNNKKILDYLYKSFRMVLMLSIPMILGIIVISDSFVPIFFGKGYKNVSLLMKVISPILLLIGLSNVCGTQYLLPTKRQKEFTISVVGGAIINFIINMLLIPKYGALGASIGTVIAELSVTLVQIYYVRNDFNFKKIIKMSFNYILASIIMFISCFLIGYLINNNLYSLLTKLTIGVLIYGITLFLLKDEFILNLLNKIRKKVC